MAPLQNPTLFKRVLLLAAWCGAWGLGVVTMVFIFGSFLTQLYGPPPRDLLSLTGVEGSTADTVAAVLNDDPTWARAWCAATLSCLQVELEEQFAQGAARVQYPRAQRHFEAWQRQWKNRLEAALSVCKEPGETTLAQAAKALADLDMKYAAARRSITEDSRLPRQRMKSLLDTVKR